MSGARPVLARALAEQRLTLLLATILAALWGVVLMVIVATSDARTQSLGGAPGGVLSAFRLIGLDPTTIWVTIGASHPFFVALIGVVAISRGVRAVAGALEDGTLVLALTRPVRRSTWILAHAAALLPGAVLLPAGYAVGATVADRIRDPPGGPLAAGRMLLFVAEAGLLVLALGLLALAISAWSTERGPALARAVGGTLALFAINLLAGAWDVLGPLRYATPFGWFSPGPTIQHGAVPWGDLAALAAIAAASLALALWRFTRRDLV